MAGWEESEEGVSEDRDRPRVMWGEVDVGYGLTGKGENKCSDAAVIGASLWLILLIHYAVS